MILLGLTGAIGHGKSTFAETLHVYEPDLLHLETNMPVIDVAEALQARLITEQLGATPACIQKVLSFLPQIIEDQLRRNVAAEDIIPTLEEITAAPEQFAKLNEYLQAVVANPAMVGASITAANKPAYRPLLQWIGGFLIQRIDALIWIGEVIERARDYEASGGALAVIGGIRFSDEAHVVQEGGGKVILIQRPGQAEADLQDPTERERASIIPDATVINSGSVTDLLDIAQRMLVDLRNGSLQVTYQPRPRT